MTMEPTREEWLEAWERVRRLAFDMAREGYASSLTEAALGPCPPPPPPEGWHKGTTISGLGCEIRHDQIMLWAGDSMCGCTVNPDDACHLGDALVRLAEWKRAQEMGERS